MVSVLPSAVVADCGKVLATPPVITLMPWTVRVCRPSGAVTVKVPVWVRAGLLGLLPSPRFFS
ncbi:hypothetical protein D3C85_1544090 [compost metagenome]